MEPLKISKLLSIKRNSNSYPRSVAVGYWILVLAVMAPCLLFLWLPGLRVFYATPFLSCVGILVFGGIDYKGMDEVNKLRAGGYFSLFLAMQLQALFIWIFLDKGVQNNAPFQSNILNSSLRTPKPSNPIIE